MKNGGYRDFSSSSDMRANKESTGHQFPINNDAFVAGPLDGKISKIASRLARSSWSRPGFRTTLSIASAKKIGTFWWHQNSSLSVVQHFGNASHRRGNDCAAAIPRLRHDERRRITMRSEDKNIRAKEIFAWIGLVTEKVDSVGEPGLDRKSPVKLLVRTGADQVKKRARLVLATILKAAIRSSTPLRGCIPPTKTMAGCFSFPVREGPRSAAENRSSRSAPRGVWLAGCPGVPCSAEPIRSLQ